MFGFAPAQGLASSSLTSAAFPLLAPNGTAAAPSYSWSNSGYGDDGFFHGGAASIIHLSLNGVSKAAWITADKYAIASDMALAWHSGTNVDSGSSDVYLVRDAAAVLALKNGTTAQEFRVYGTTTGSKYAKVSHDGTFSYFASSSGPALLRSDADTYAAIQTNGATRWYVDGSTTNYGLVANANYRFSHGTSALATTATEGFMHLQTCAGAPTGVPASIPTGQAPYILDTVNDRWYFYYDDGGGAAWHYIARTA